MASVSTIRRDRAGLASTASRCVASSIDKHQISGRSRAGHARGHRCAQVLVADYQPQDWSALCRAGMAGRTNSGPNNCAGIPRRLSHSHWLGISSLTSHRRSVRTSLGAGRLQLPVRAIRRCARPFIHANPAGANRLCVRNTLPHKQIPNALACRLHHHRSFRNPSSFDGQELSGRHLPNGQKHTVRSAKND